MQAKTALVAVLATTLALGCHAKRGHGPEREPGLGERLSAIVKKKPMVLPPLRVARLGDDVRRSGALLLAKTGERAVALVLDQDDVSIDELDLDGGTPIAKTRLTSAPRGALLLGDGTLAVVLPDESAVAVFARHVEGASYREVRRYATPEDPRALALSPDDATLYVTTGASHTLVAFEANGRRELARTDLPRGPRGLTTSADGSKIYVSHATYNATSVLESIPFLAGHGAPSAVSHGVGHCAPKPAHAPTDPEGECMDDLARHGRVILSAVKNDQEDILAPVVLARPTPLFAPMKTTMIASDFGPSDFGGPFGFGNGDGGITGYGSSASSGPAERFEVRSVGGLASGTSNRPILSPESKCLLPVSAAYASATDTLYVACAGTNRVEAFGTTPSKKKRSVDVGGSPDAIALVPGGQKLAVWSSQTRALSLHTLTRSRPATSASITDSPIETKIYTAVLPRSVEKDPTWLAGRELFTTTFDKRISGDGRACASCHVDGADDAIVWSTPQGKRRTRTLEGQLESGPYGWMGEHKTLADHVKVTERQLGGTGLPEAEREKLLTYVRTLGAKPTRTPTSKPLGDEAEKGRTLFVSQKYDCATCHAGGGVDSDREVHDVGSGGTFLTPTLASVSTRPRLFHDGKYKSLDELLANAKSMGRANEMTADERRAMSAYLASL